LSVLEDVSYDACDVALAPGDLLLLYTDGVVEIATENDEEYGVERLEGVVRRSQSLPASAMIDQIVRDTQRFSGRESFEDDFTLVIIRRAQDIPGYASDS
jgi:sigma-B regulation protein RsbU (phosphoserine phosphatase)